MIALIFGCLVFVNALSLHHKAHYGFDTSEWTYQQLNSLLARSQPSSNPQPQQQPSPQPKSPQPPILPQQTPKQYSPQIQSQIFTASTPTSPYSQQIIDPYQKMYKWAQNNENLKDALKFNKPLTKQQKSILVNYMINDQYFVQQLSEQLEMDEDNKWVKQLGPRALKRYVKIVGSLDQQMFQDSVKLKEVEQKLMDDYEIGTVYLENVKSKKQRVLECSYNLIASNYL